MQAACVTGHRWLARPEETRAALAAALDRAIKEGFATFYVGMALGADQMAAELLAGRARVVAAIPCDGYDRPWPAGAQARHRTLLGLVDEVVLYPGGPYAPWKPHARNRWMVDRSGLVIAVYDGRGHGGTFRTVQYAQARGAPIWFVPC